MEYKLNTGTVQRLQRNKWGSWFITSTLTGCEVWIARCFVCAHDIEPFIVHINAIDYCKGHTISQCLERKYKMASVVLDYMNSEIKGAKYKFTARFLSGLQDYPRGYLDKFEVTTKIKTCLYQGPAVFYGTYTNDHNPGWYFELQDCKTKRANNNVIVSILLSYMRIPRIRHCQDQP